MSVPGHSYYNCNTTKTSVALPIRADLTGVQCRPRSNGAIGILTDPWRPVLRCYYDSVQWIILLGHEVCAIGFEKITCMSSFCQVAKSEWEPELDLWVNSSEFRNVSSGDSG